MDAVCPSCLNIFIKNTKLQFENMLQLLSIFDKLQFDISQSFEV